MITSGCSTITVIRIALEKMPHIQLYGLAGLYSKNLYTGTMSIMHTCAMYYMYHLYRKSVIDMALLLTLLF